MFRMVTVRQTVAIRLRNDSLGPHTEVVVGPYPTQVGQRTTYLPGPKKPKPLAVAAGALLSFALATFMPVALAGVTGGVFGSTTVAATSALVQEAAIRAALAVAARKLNVSTTIGGVSISYGLGGLTAAVPLGKAHLRLGGGGLSASAQLGKHGSLGLGTNGASVSYETKGITMSTGVSLTPIADGLEGVRFGVAGTVRGAPIQLVNWTAADVARAADALAKVPLGEEPATPYAPVPPDEPLNFTSMQPDAGGAEPGPVKEGKPGKAAGRASGDAAAAAAPPSGTTAAAGPKAAQPEPGTFKSETTMPAETVKPVPVEPDHAPGPPPPPPVDVPAWPAPPDPFKKHLVAVDAWDGCLASAGAAALLSPLTAFGPNREVSCTLKATVPTVGARSLEGVTKITSNGRGGLEWEVVHLNLSEEYGVPPEIRTGQLFSSVGSTSRDGPFSGFGSKSSAVVDSVDSWVRFFFSKASGKVVTNVTTCAIPPSEAPAEAGSAQAVNGPGPAELAFTTMVTKDTFSFGSVKATFEDRGKVKQDGSVCHEARATYELKWPEQPTAAQFSRGPVFRGADAKVPMWAMAAGALGFVGCTLVTKQPAVCRTAAVLVPATAR